MADLSSTLRLQLRSAVVAGGGLLREAAGGIRDGLVQLQAEPSPSPRQLSLERELEQARREVLEEQLERHRLQAALERMASSQWLLERIPRPGPLAFPLLVERLNNRLSNESLLERVQRLISEAQRAEARA